MRTLIAVVAAAALLGGCSGTPDSNGDRAAVCAAELEYQGHRYSAHGEVKRDPDITGRVDVATVPACGDGNGAASARQVEVAELADIRQQRAVLMEGRLYVRADLPFPTAARGWFVAPRCVTDEPFVLAGDWLSVRGPHEPRFDGDLRPPYRVGVHVTNGPEEYVGATIQIRATRQTDPALGPADAKTSLWEGGDLSAKVRCMDETFEAISLTSTP